MRLIDADTLRKDVEKDRDASDMPKMWYQGVEYAINHIIHAPTIDAVEVVRCKDCKHNYHNMIPDGEAEYGCTKCIELPITANFYCAWGERREDADT